MTNRYGLLAFLQWNHDWNHFHFPESILPQAIRQIHELGVSFVRIDIIWADIHRGYGKYDFDRYDRLINLIRDENINILAVLHYNKETGDLKNPRWNHPPDSFEEFAEYVGSTVHRYKALIHHWEIWNEPNLPLYWAGPKDGLRLYCSLLKKSYMAAKEADPRCTVMNGGLTEPIVHDVDNLFRHSGNRYTDVVNIHVFLDPFSPSVQTRFNAIIEGVYEVMDKYSDKKKIWITEMGCPGVPPGKENLTWFAGRALTESEQAEWVETQTKLIRKYPDIERLFWAFYRDTLNEFKDAGDYLGLVRFDLSPKPAFEKLKHIIAKDLMD